MLMTCFIHNHRRIISDRLQEVLYLRTLTPKKQRGRITADKHTSIYLYNKYESNKYINTILRNVGNTH